MKVRQKINTDQKIDIIAIAADNDEERVFLKELYDTILEKIKKFSGKQLKSYDKEEVKIKYINSFQSPEAIRPDLELRDKRLKAQRITLRKQRDASQT